MSIDLLTNLHKFEVAAVDVETTGLHWYRDKMFGVAVAGYDGERVHSAYYDVRDQPRVIDALKDQLPRCKKVVNHNIKFDVHFLMNEGININPDAMECTSVRAALINEHEISFSLDALAQKYLGKAKVDIYKELATIFGGQPTRAVQMNNLHRAPVELVRKYAAPDPELAIWLWLQQEQDMRVQGLQQVWDLERRLTPVLIDMERHGVRIDADRAQKSLGNIDRTVGNARRALNKMAGKEVNANSAPQMRALFKAAKGEDGRWRSGNVLLETTDGGEASIGADTLRTMAERGNDLAAKVLSIRKLTKAKSFLKDHILGHELHGRVFPNYNQTRGESGLGTGTGRFSVNDPALQQIPARDKEIAAIVRACFLPEAKRQWLCADWEQFEFRWFAHYTNDERLLSLYRNDPTTDFHGIVGGLTSLPRSARFAGDPNAKQINLGLVFGMGDGRLAEEMGLEYTVGKRNGREYLIPGEAAKAVFNQYHEAIPGVRALLDRASSVARSRGYVKTAIGRHIRFPGGKFTHKAGGLVFQGSSADCMKQKMVELYPFCKKEGIHMLLSVHDELNFSTPKDSRAGRIQKLIKQKLETFDGKECPIECRVPILSSIGVGDNWWDASK